MFGDPDVYVEPFAGSLAVLLSRTVPCSREIVNDVNGYICNVWRSIREDPERVAYYANWPTIHQDLVARHEWLMKWGKENSHKLIDDPDWYDPKAAGWWIWGKSCWAGGNDWCTRHSEGAPGIGARTGGKGVQAQRITDDGGGSLLEGTRWLSLFKRLADRLSGVIVVNRDWKDLFSPTYIQQAKVSGNKSVAVFLDPPYQTDIAKESFEWAVENGNEYRICYACLDGDFSIPEGWVYRIKGLQGIRNTKKRETMTDAMMFSPACFDGGLI